MFFMRSNVLRWRGGGRVAHGLKGERSAWGSPQQAVFGYQIRSLPTLCNADIIGEDSTDYGTLHQLKIGERGGRFGRGQERESAD